MKKLFLIVAAMFAVVSFSACSDDDDKDVNPNQIIGTWQITREVGYEIVAGEGKMEKDITYPIDDVNDDYGFYFTYTFNEDGTGRYKSYYYYDNNKLDSNWSVEYTISNNQLLIYEEPEEGNPTSVYEIKELTKNKLVLLYKVDDSDGYKAEITTTFKKNLIHIPKLKGQTCAKGLTFRLSAQVCPFYFTCISHKFPYIYIIIKDLMTT